MVKKKCMDELSKLGIKYGTDKIGKHNYLPVYYDLFKDRRNEVKKVLEIGVGEGAGLRMFRDFFPNALIYGIDNQNDRIFEEVGIKVFKADQSSKDQLLEALDEILPGPNDLDLVIDDGSHKSEDQIFTCLTLMPHLRLGNTIYIIEDVADETIFNDLFNSNMEWQGSLRMIKAGKRNDDSLLIITKKKNQI